jgi:hypothetical protein
MNVPAHAVCSSPTPTFVFLCFQGAVSKHKVLLQTRKRATKIQKILENLLKLSSIRHMRTLKSILRADRNQLFEIRKQMQNQIPVNQRPSDDYKIDERSRAG